MAECSLSMGNSVARPSRTVCMNNPPPTTSASLLASSNLLPARAAARHGARPAAPTMAATTASGQQAAAVLNTGAALDEGLHEISRHTHGHHEQRGKHQHPPAL